MTSGKHRNELRELLRGKSVCITRCARCSWRFDGPVAEGAVAFREHLAAEHPDVSAIPRDVAGGADSRFDARIVAS